MSALGERRSPLRESLGRDREILEVVAPGVRRIGVQLVLWKHPDVWVERWLVDSRHGLHRYVVARSATGAWGCSCPRWIYHREQCWHIRAIPGALDG